MESIAGWIAAAATLAGAVMTASNLGTRTTGWGFAAFTIGSAAWIVNAASAGQTSLLVTNGFLAVVNLFGVWRWLGRKARIEDASRAAMLRSRIEPVPELIALSRLTGCPLLDERGERIGELIETMADRASGRPAYVVASIGGVGGVGAALFAIRPGQLRFGRDETATLVGVADPEAELPELREPWPVSLPPGATARG